MQRYVHFWIISEFWVEWNSRHELIKYITENSISIPSPTLQVLYKKEISCVEAALIPTWKFYVTTSPIFCLERHCSSVFFISLFESVTQFVRILVSKTRQFYDECAISSRKILGSFDTFFPSISPSLTFIFFSYLFNELLHIFF